MRSILSTVLVVLVALLTPLSALAVWADREIGDTDGYVTAMAPLATDRAMENAVADRITDEVMKGIGPTPVQEGFQDGVPDAMRDVVHDAVISFAATDAYRTAWNSVNQAAHTAVEKALTNHHNGETASIDLAPVLEQLKAQLSADGVPYAGKIPVGSARIAVLDSDRLGAAREVFDVLQTAGIRLPVATLILATIVLFLTPRRLPALALALAVGGLLLLLTVVIGRALTLGDLPAHMNRPAATAAFDALTSTLRVASWWLTGVGAATALFLWHSRRNPSPSEPATARPQGADSPA
ncbi:hypothetical protein ACWEFL_21630 [Streptomyces sp. NPDC004838]